MATQRSRRLLLALTPPLVAAYGIHYGLSTLEARYPALPANDSTCSFELRTPTSPGTQHSPHIDIYSARIPVRYLLRPEQSEPDAVALTPDFKTTVNLPRAWAKAVLGSRIFRLEGSMFGLFANRVFEPGDIGNTPGEFGPIHTELRGKEGRSETKEEKRKLLHGALTVERPPSNDNPCGLLISWKMPDEPRLFFEKIARWGYLWRLMSGGRHELSVSESFNVPGREAEGPFVEVRFASAHDYEIVPDEGDISRQKTIPAFPARLHRGYAMFILDQAVKELSKANQ
ncbi:hypothetical protein BJY04DRAFT_170470 [Aspergillus karnatakaensis]|uniref:uncharacterized protein n=1 Tax=Aspergillus karnatakaensis TaxID=1810916 RepID=UPI003CCD82E0